MKNRINRAKKFVADHTHGIATTTGLVVGVAVTYHVMNPVTREAFLHLTLDQAKVLMEKPGEMVVTFDTPRQTVHVIVDALNQ